MGKRKLLILIVISGVMLAGLGGFLLVNSKGDDKNSVKSSATLENVTSEQIGMSIEKEKTLVQSDTSTSENEDSKELWRFVQPADSQQQFVISSYYEQGASLKKLTSVTKMSLKDAVLDNVSRQLPQQYPEYKEINKKDLEVNGTQATEITFEYVSQNTSVKQRLMLLFKNNDTVVYIRGQAKTADFDEVNSKYFEPIFSSAKFK